MTPETKLKKEVVDFLKSVGVDCWFYQPVMSGYGKRGVPDFIGCYQGHFFSIETKAQGNTLTPWQERCNKEIGEARGTAMVVYKIDEVKRMFNVIFRGA